MLFNFRRRDGDLSVLEDDLQGDGEQAAVLQLNDEKEVSVTEQLCSAEGLWRGVLQPVWRLRCPSLVALRLREPGDEGRGA